jgi:DNA-binding transcriptional ArsR family regulator
MALTQIKNISIIMNVSLDLESTNRRSSKPGSSSQSGCGLDCKEELFGNLADHSQLSILQTLCEDAKTEAQIATATSLSQRDLSFHLERLLSCGCVKAADAGHSVFYGLSAPWLVQLEGIVDEMLTAALKEHRAPLNRDGKRTQSARALKVCFTGPGLTLAIADFPLQ